MLVLANLLVHETNLANQHFYSTLLGRREGVCKKSTLCMLVKILKIMDVPKLWRGMAQHFRKIFMP